MRKAIVGLLLCLAVVSFATTALAEHGPIKPWSTRTFEHGPIRPW